MKRWAEFSLCRRYRYSLWREWGPRTTYAMFIGLNPSTADADVDDPTIRRCVGFAKGFGFGRIEVVNLFAFRATKPADLRAAGYPVGEFNDLHIVSAGARAAVVCVAWGAAAGGLARPLEVLALLREAGLQPRCLRVTSSGHPQHPLYLPASCELRAYNPG